jgi:predicted alpha/beta hydrolase
MREYSREGHHVAYESEVKLEPSQWHEGSFAVENRFARDLADLLTEEGFDVLEERPQH